jgi:hypothetical protein
LPPNRPLTEQEVLLSSVERARAVVTAVLLETGDEFYERRGGDGSGQFVPVAEIRVLKSLKGALRPNQKIRIQLSQDWRGEGQSKGAVLIFLQQYPSWVSEFAPNDKGSRPTWFALSGVYGHGVKELSPGSAAREEAAAKRAIRLAEPDSLATLADVVVIAAFLDSLECMSQGRRWPCMGIREQLYGDPISSPIHVQAAVPGYVQDGLLYLKRIGPRTYETIGLAAGAQRIKDDKVGYGKRSLAQVRQLLRAAERNRKKKGLQ